MYWKNYVVLLLDEMKVKESLVYDKNSCQVVGFVQLDDINYQMSMLENQSSNNLPPVASHLLTMMVRGLFTNYKVPYAHFPTDSLTGDQLFPIVWEAVERLERKGFKVIAIKLMGQAQTGNFSVCTPLTRLNSAIRPPIPTQKYILLLRCSSPHEDYKKLLVTLQQKRNQKSLGKSLHYCIIHNCVVHAD